MIGNKYPSHTVMDVRIHAVTMEEALRCAREMAASGEEHIIATANAEMVMIAQEDKELAYVLNHCSLVVPDGAGILGRVNSWEHIFLRGWQAPITRKKSLKSR